MLSEIRIFPPLGIARLGSSQTPMANYTLTAPSGASGYREITPLPTLVVEGDHVARVIPASEVDLRFKVGDAIRPVCPFFEVWGRFDDADVFVPLTAQQLEEDGLSPEANIRWRVVVGNLKAFRRTGIEADKVLADTGLIGDFDIHALDGHSANFVGGLQGEFIPFGSVRYLRPTAEFGKIQLRFTPAAGKVYGPTGRGDDPNVAKAVYDTSLESATWHQHLDGDAGKPPTTSPGGIYAQKRNDDGRLVDENGTVITAQNRLRPVNLGYLDDACDGLISVELEVETGRKLTASARVSVGPPDFAPDSLPVRTVMDELEQTILGAQATGSVTIGDASDILRRAMETVRLMNTVAMNGPNGYAGHLRRFDPTRTFFFRKSSPEETDRQADPTNVISAHEAALDDMLAENAVLFDTNEFLRRSDDVGDLSDDAVQKMPAMMRGSDGMPITLTKRQRSKLAIGEEGLVPNEPVGSSGSVEALNVTAQASQLPGSPNPASAYPNTAIANCFPGLEFDFRNIWRRIFIGLRIHESTFQVVGVDDDAPTEYAGLEGSILLTVDGRNVYSEARNPQNPPPQPLYTNLEWTNSLAHIARRSGEQIRCVFQVGTTTRSHDVTVRDLFDKSFVDGVARETAVLSPAMVEPGELTQGLCSPWQADFRECGCYYWAASRPDYVNTEVVEGVTRGHNWLLKRDANTPTDAPREYNHTYRQMITYDDLYQAWEKYLSFVIKGKDANAP